MDGQSINQSINQLIVLFGQSNLSPFGTSIIRPVVIVVDTFLRSNVPTFVSGRAGVKNLELSIDPKTARKCTEESLDVSLTNNTNSSKHHFLTSNVQMRGSFILAGDVSCNTSVVGSIDH